MPHERITEYYPSTSPEGHKFIVCRAATAPRDLASTILLWTYCCFAVAQVALAVTVAVAAGVHLRPAGVCLLENHAGEHESCYLTYTASGLTIPICAAAVALEILPERVVAPGVRNMVPLLLLLLGTILWGVDAAAVHANINAMTEEVAASVAAVVSAAETTHWRTVVEGLSWSNMALFLTAATIKLFDPQLNSCLDSISIRLGRLCPDTCMPACDACCCLDVRTAKVPREVLRHGQVQVRFLSWNLESVPEVPGKMCMTRLGA